LVQIEPGGIGPTIDKIQALLGDSLGKARRNQSEGTVTLIYRMESEGSPVISMRMKVEINTREHFAVDGFRKIPFSVDSRWFQGSCEVTTYTLDEFLGTKMRALYQRRKGRDLIDLWLGLTEGNASAEHVVDIFRRYMDFEGNAADSRIYEKNLRDKMKHPGFASDIESLLPDGASYDLDAAFNYVDQIHNFLNFCEALSSSEAGLAIELVTGTDTKRQEEDASAKLDEIKESLSQDRISLTCRFEAGLHDRWIEVDTGWRIILGRGLDIFQKPEGKFTLGFVDQTKRRCKATTITYVKNG
jgi:hypothetical protein